MLNLTELCGFGVGANKVAPTYISSANAKASTLTMPTHQAGDLLVFQAYNMGALTIPTLASGYTSAFTATDTGGADSCVRVAYKIATSASETSGTWTNANCLLVHVYRGVNPTTPIGANAFTGYAVTGAGTVTYPALTLTATDSTSMVVAGAAHNDAGITLAVTGLTTRTTYTTTDSFGSFDSDGGTSSWAGFASAQGGNSAWISVAFEVLAA